MMDTVERKVMGFVAERAEVSSSEISLNSTFEELGIDSLAALSIALDVETEFGLDIPDEDVFSLRTVGDVVAGIRARLDPDAAKGV